MSAPELDYKSAVCFVPPRAFWDDPVQEIRCFNDKAFVRWPPHVNLLYPFWQDDGDSLGRAASILRSALESFPPFSVTFSEFRFFAHGRSCTVWLEPASDSLAGLQATLVQAFPECHHLSSDPARGVAAFTPHLSVGQWPDKRRAMEAVARLSLDFEPMQVPFDSVVVLHRRAFQTPFEFRFRIPLGASSDADVEEVNVGYVATLGAESRMHVDHPYGLGSYAQGVWNFACGANVNRAKLVEDRQIVPLESVPGVLEGYRLAFNHHGGMGNVVRMTHDVESDFNARGIYGVHGVLYRLSFTDFARLSNMESGYRPLELDVEASDGRGKIRAVVFESPKQRNVVDGLPPTERYLRLIVKGAKEWNLDGAYVKWLEALESVPAGSRGPVYWQTPHGRRIPDRITRVGGDPQTRNPQRRYD